MAAGWGAEAGRKGSAWGLRVREHSPRLPRHSVGRGAAIQRRAVVQGVLRGLLACCAHVTGDAREDATLKIARTARAAGAMRKIIGILRVSEGVTEGA